MKNYKLSMFTVVTDPIIRNGYQIIYSTRTTGKVLLSVKVFNKILNNEFEKISKNILNELIKNKIIVEEYENELEIVIKSNKIAIENYSTLSYTIMPSANCQLGCDYCGQKHENKTISDALANKIVARIEEKLKSNSKYNKVFIEWFGAEPLMGLNKIKVLSKRLIDLSKQYDCSYKATMTTNGLSLKPNIYSDLSQECKISRFEITLDGAGDNHDSRRFTKAGGKSFDLILKNIENIVLSKKYDVSNGGIKIRCNIDVRNKESVFELINILDQKNILHKLVAVYIAPIHSWGNDAHKLSVEKKEFAKLQMDFFMKLQEKKYQVNQSLTPNQVKKVVCLAVQKDGELIDSYGNVFNCPEIPLVPTYELNDQFYPIGHLGNNTTLNTKPKPMSDWNDLLLDKDFPCSTCNILPICGGSCPKHWLENLSPCPIFKYNIEDRLIYDFSKQIKSGEKSDLLLLK